MEKKTFNIAGISSHDELNALSIALNEKEQVSHMKIGKNNISFKCVDIEVLVKTIHDVNKDFVIEEVVDGKKREYDFSEARDRKYYFMFKNLVNEDDILTLVKKIKNEKKYKDVKYDIHNKVLVLISDEKEVLKKIKMMLKKINPSIEIYEHKRPIRSQDVFHQKYLMNYLRISCLLVAFALAIVTSKDKSPLTTLFWIIALLILGEKTTRSAWKNICSFHIFHEDVLVTIGLVLGVVSGAVLESFVALILYILSEPLRIKILRRSFMKIDEAIEKPEKGIRDLDDHSEMIPLQDFEIGDVIIVAPNEMISIPGTIIEGHSSLNTYPNTGSYDYVEVKAGDSVHSGDINLRETIKVRITDRYESGNLAHMMDIAATAPVHQSKAEKYIQKFSYWYTPIIVVIAFIVGIVLPIVSLEDFGQYIHVGAILFLLSGSFSTEQSASLGMLAGFAKAFQEGIYIESALGLDSINTAQVIIYDTIDNEEVTSDELELFDKLSHLGKIFMIFNDSNKLLENEEYKIYNYISTQEKLEIIDNALGPVVYIGDSSKDIECFQKSYVAISRGGISDSKVVENSDIVLVDSSFDKVFETFSIARKMRTKSVVNLIFSLVIKLILVVVACAMLPIRLWLVVVIEALVVIAVMYNAINILE